MRAFLNTLKFDVVQKCNNKIYFFRQIPIIGKKIPYSLYSKSTAKDIITVFSILLNILFEFIKKSAYVFIMAIVPVIFINEKIYKTTYCKSQSLLIFFSLTFIMGSAVRSKIMNTDNNGFNMITLMRMNPREYYTSQILYRVMSEFVFFQIIMHVLTGSILKSSIILLELAAFRLIFEAVYLLIYDKLSVFIHENNVYLAVIIIGCLAVYAAPFFNIVISPDKYILNPVFFVISIIMGIISFMYIFKYKKYRSIAKYYLNFGKLMEVEKELENVNVSQEIDSIKMDEKTVESSAVKNKTGYDYLNNIFFLRHKKIMKDAVKIRTIIVLVIGVILSLICFFINDAKKDLPDWIMKSMPYFVFIMYAISVTERVCRAMFFNCDRSLLKYGYYKQPGAILLNFKIRLKKIISLNLIPALALCLVIITTFLICRGSISLRILPICVGIIFLSVFFSVHYLFMYYVLQPYTEKMKVKSPTFTAVNTLMYFLCYMCINIKISSVYFTLAIIAGTFIYIVVALILTYKLAPKTFELRK